MVSVVTFTSILNQLLPEPHAGLLAGILFGTKATMSRELTDSLIRTGTLHIVALSGTNITILTNLVNLSLLWLVGRRWASVLTIALITGFIWFVGPSPSVIRAGIMGGISLIAVIFGRQTWGLLTWMLAVSTMLLLNPGWISDLSFQLSAMATLGIILFGKPQNNAEQYTEPRGRSAGETILRSTEDPPQKALQELFPWFGGGASLSEEREDLGELRGVSRASPKNTLLPRSLLLGYVPLWRLIRDNLRLTLAAQVFTIPIIFWYFHRVSLISPVTNLLIGWIVPPLTVLGLGTAVAGLVFWPFGQLLAWFAWVPLQYLITVVEWTSRVPGASIGQ